MVNLELGEMQKIAEQYSEGNISRYVRNLIKEDHHQRMDNKLNKNIKIVTMKDNFINNIIFFTMGITFLVIALFIQTEYSIIVTNLAYIVTGLSLLAYFILKIMKKEEKKWI